MLRGFETHTYLGIELGDQHELLPPVQSQSLEPGRGDVTGARRAGGGGGVQPQGGRERVAVCGGLLRPNTCDSDCPRKARHDKHDGIAEIGAEAVYTGTKGIACTDSRGLEPALLLARRKRSTAAAARQAITRAKPAGRTGPKGAGARCTC